MHPVVFVPLVSPVVAAGAARHVAERVDPRLATWLLTVSATLLAGASGLALVAIAVTALGQVGFVADVGGWSVPGLRGHDPTSLSTAVLACLGVACALLALVKVAVARIVASTGMARTARRLPGADSLTVLDDPVPDAYAVPGRPGRIVVSTGMLRALDPAERRALLAHERAHLRYTHHAFVTLAQVASAANPLLRPTATAVAYAVERWADEHAARSLGDRLLIARTIGKAALLAGRHRCRPVGEPAGRRRVVPGGDERDRVQAGVGADRRQAADRAPVMPVELGSPRRPAAVTDAVHPTRPGSVPRRILALASAPPRRGLLVLAATVALLGVATVTAVETARDVQLAFERARQPEVSAHSG